MDSNQKASSKNLSSKDILEKKLYLQQLQINRLLELTQAINDNLKIDDLFRIFKDTLSWEMRIKKFAFVTRVEDKWECVAFSGIEKSIFHFKDAQYLSKFQRTAKIEEKDDPFLREFSIVIPVYHKKYPIAFTFIGEDFYETEEDVYEPIRYVSAISNIIAVAIENKRLFKKQLEQERLKRDLELAVQVQNMLIPGKLPLNNNYEFDGVYQPHEGVGGDYYDLFELGNKELAFCIADISGKGIAAALVMSNFQANLQSLVNKNHLSVTDFANQLNEKVLNTTKGERFITFFIARYHRYKKILRYINAGHNPPIMISSGKVKRLDRGCTVLGAFTKLPKVEWGEIELNDDAFFLLYTDGLIDIKNDNNEFFDEKRVLEFAMENHTLPVKEFNSKLKATLNDFKGQQDFPDDISFLSGRIYVSNYAHIDNQMT